MPIILILRFFTQTTSKKEISHKRTFFLFFFPNSNVESETLPKKREFKEDNKLSLSKPFEEELSRLLICYKKSRGAKCQINAPLT